MPRALVTGGGGFLGSHLVARLEDTGHDVFVARRRDYDLTRYDDTERLFEDARPELVFHLAAEVGGIGANRANPGRYWYANLLMGAHVLELARLHGVAKKSVLVGAQSYREQYGTNAIHLLPVNLYGPRDNFNPETAHVIPDLIRKMHERTDQVVLWGDGSPTREFLYVEDCADGLALAAERYDGAEPVNLGTGNEIAIRDLASLIAELTGFTGEIVWDTSMPNGQPRRSLDTTRAKELFGWEARTDFREGLERTIAWYREHMHAHVAR